MTSLLTVMDDGAGPEPEVRRAQADPGNAPGNWDDLRLNLVGSYPSSRTAVTTSVM